jgi:hypothetical protein
MNAGAPVPQRATQRANLLTTSLACAALALVPAAAHGSAIGDREVGLAGAVIATGWEPGSAHYNPAGLASLKRRSISLSANAYQLESRQLDGLVQSIQADGSSVDSTDRADGFMSFPARFLYTYPFTWGRWNAGLALGLLVPKAGKRHEVAAFDDPETGKSEQTYSDLLSTQQQVFDLRVGGLIGGALGAALWTFAPGASPL